MPRTATLIVEHPQWLARTAHLRRWLSKSCWAVCAQLGLNQALSLTVLCTDDTTIYGLNHQFRGKLAPTNVLSFPCGEVGETGETMLGDIVISMDTLTREAAAQEKTEGDHCCHLFVHSFLHLLGHDHENDAEAEAMEALEASVLARLGIRNPYL